MRHDRRGGLLLVLVDMAQGRYKKKLDAAGVFPSDLQSIEDIAKLPFTEKTELRDVYPYGLLACEESEIVEVHTSSGTTGTPVVGAYTIGDIETPGLGTLETDLGVGQVSGDVSVRPA